MTTETSRAAEIDAAVKKSDAAKVADAAKAAADAARADADAGEKLDLILTHLDSLNRRMDAYDAKDAAAAHADDDGDNGDDPDNKKPIKQDSRSRKKDTMDDSARADAEEVGLGRVYMDADQASSAWGKSAPHPWQTESIANYRRRVAKEHQPYSEAWKTVDLHELSGAALQNAVAQIFADSAAAARSPSVGCPEGYLREVVTRDKNTGHVIREFIGEPRAWMAMFAGGPKRYARLNIAPPQYSPFHLDAAPPGDR